MLIKKITIIAILFLVSLALIGQNTATQGLTKTVAISDISTIDNDINEKAAELKSFSADIENKNVLVNWSVSNTNDVLGFELFQSTDGSNWEMIGFVDGDDATDFNFSFVDETPNWGINFYRLKSVNMDGNNGFLRTTKIVFEYTTGAEVADFYPNPATNGTTNLNINIPDGGNAMIYLYDSMGKLAKTFQKEIESGADTISFDLSDLSYGMFYAKIDVNRASYTKKIMVRATK